MASSHPSRNLAGPFAFPAASGGQQGASRTLHLHLEDIRHAEIELLAARFHKRPISVTFVIGGKLRALLDDQVPPPPDCMADLLLALDMNAPAN